MTIDVVEVVVPGDIQVIEFADTRAPAVIEVVVPGDIQVIEFADTRTPAVIEALVERDLQVLEVLVPGQQGPTGNTAIGGDKTFTYVAGKLAQINYENGASKTLTYLPNGDLTRIVHSLTSNQIVRDFVYGGGFLIGINEAVAP